MKKILSLALAALMVVSVLPVAYAADVDYTAGTAVEYTADADANRNYTITVPAELQPGQSGTVTLKGMWASNETVTVTADASVELTNSINAADKHTLAITFPGIEKAGDNTVEKSYTETVSVAAMPAAALFGEWTGKFNYNVEFDDGIVFSFDDIYVLQNDETNYIELYPEGKIYKSVPGMNYTGYKYVGNEIQSASAGTVRYTASEDGLTLTEIETGNVYVRTAPPQIVTFTIASKTYQTEWKMKWIDWLESEYNTDGFTMNGNESHFTIKSTSGDWLAYLEENGGTSARGFDSTTIIKPYEKVYLQ